MKSWEFKNSIKVFEEDYNYDLHCLKVYKGESYLGTVYPGTIEDMHECMKCLDNGDDPITDGWEDGCGNPCTLEGWE